MIKLIIFDIDGILTDNTIIIDDTGREQKRINFKDVDAIYELHRLGYQLGAITGEGNDMVEYFRRRFPWDYFYFNNKQKKETVKKLSEEISIPLEQICFIGEGKYDVDVLSFVGLGVCPSDAIDRAKDSANIILNKRGGDGCVWELIGILERYKDINSIQAYYIDKLKGNAERYKMMATDIKMINAAIYMGIILKDLLQKKKQIFLCGFEGSVACAKYMVYDLKERFGNEQTVHSFLPMEFKENKVLKEKAANEDLLILILNDKNSLVASKMLSYAKQIGMFTAAFTNDDKAFQGKELVDCHIIVQGKTSYEMVEACVFFWNIILESL